MLQIVIQDENGKTITAINLDSPILPYLVEQVDKVTKDYMEEQEKNEKKT